MQSPESVSVPLPSATAVSPSEAPPADWSLAQRIGFRFVCVYFLLYFLPTPLDAVPGLEEWFFNAASEVWEPLVSWAGMRLLGLDTPLEAKLTGSGDRAFNYVQLLCMLGLGGLGTLVWSLVDTRRTQYARAYEWLRVYLRYALASAMLVYGFSKVFKLQFPFPSPETLLQPYGESSPMGLLWTFMGYSTAYTIWAGAAEVVGGLLLLSRRTTTLGSLVVIGVMSNVVMLNFSYDVPVKIYSSHLLLLAVFLLLPDMKRLANVLVLNRPTEPVVLRAHFQSPRVERASRVLKVLLVGWVLISMVRGSLEGMRQHGDDAPKPPLYGAYEVESFIRGGQEVPPLLTDTTRWRRVIVDRFERLTIFRMDDSRQRFALELDEQKKTLTLTPRGEEQKHVLNYSQPDPEHLVLEGSWQGEPLTVRMKKIDTSKLLLVNRGFHWINEVPFSR